MLTLAKNPEKWHFFNKLQTFNSSNFKILYKVGFLTVSYEGLSKHWKIGYYCSISRQLMIFWRWRALQCLHFPIARKHEDITVKICFFMLFSVKISLKPWNDMILKWYLKLKMIFQPAWFVSSEEYLHWVGCK